MPCVNHPQVEEDLNRCVRCRELFCVDCLVEMKAGAFCALCKQEEVKDIQSGVGASGELPLAGIGARFLALIVDGLALAAVFIPIMMIFGFMVFSSMQEGADPDANEMAGMQLVMQLIMGALGVVYHGIFLQWRGQTLGKMALGIKVVTPDGSDITPGAAWIRPIVQTILSPCALTYWPALFTKEKTGIHDMAAKTRVVKIR